MKINKQKGIAMLYTIIIISVVITVTLGAMSFVIKEKTLSSVAKNSLDARASADVGLECMLYLDKAPSKFLDPNLPAYMGTFTQLCGRDASGNSISYDVIALSGSPSGYVYYLGTTSGVTGPCFEAYLYRDISVTPNTTKIEIQGYNICDTTNPRSVQRGIIAEY